MSDDYDYDSFSDIEEKYNEAKRKKIEELEQFRSQIVKKRVIINPKLRNEEEKRMLLELLKKEPVIWDKQDKLHGNCRALNAAWKRVADEMPSMTVNDCKVIWKSLKDALRYRKRIAEREKKDDSIDNSEESEENQLEIMLSLLTPAEPTSKNSSNAASEHDTSENIERKEKKRKLPQVKKYQIIRENKILRRKLTILIKKEDVIWNPRHKNHLNPSAIYAAWERIADEMHPLTVDECKAMWKSVRDSLRTSERRRKQFAECQNEEMEEAEIKQENEVQYSMSPPKSSGIKSIQEILLPDTLDNETINSILPSNFSDVSEKEETNDVYESLGSISRAISELVSVAANTQTQPQTVNSFKYDYIWRLIESLYEQLDESAINEVNQQIINLVFESCKAERE